jgi:hypothetical protein
MAPAQKNFVGFRWVQPKATPEGSSRRLAGQETAEKVNPMGIKRQKSLKKKAPDTKKNTFKAQDHGCPSGQKQRERMSVRKPKERRSRLDSGGRSATPDDDQRKVLSLSQTVTVNGQPVNICYDNGATMSMLSSECSIPNIVKGNHEIGMDPVGGGPMNFESPPLVTVPLLLAGGGVGAAHVTVTKGEFPPMTTDPPLGKITETMGMPPAAFAPRKKGKVQLILGQDNAHLWPHPVAVSRDPVFSLQFLKSRIGGGLVYAGSLAAGWRSRCGITVAKTEH